MLLSNQEYQMYMVLTLHKIIIWIVRKVLYKSSFWIPVSLPVKWRCWAKWCLTHSLTSVNRESQEVIDFLWLFLVTVTLPPSPLASLPSSPGAWPITNVLSSVSSPLCRTQEGSRGQAGLWIDAWSCDHLSLFLYCISQFNWDIIDVSLVFISFVKLIIKNKWHSCSISFPGSLLFL